MLIIICWETSQIYTHVVKILGCLKFEVWIYNLMFVTLQIDYYHW